MVESIVVKVNEGVLGVSMAKRLGLRREAARATQDIISALCCAMSPLSRLTVHRGRNLGIVIGQGEVIRYIPLFVVLMRMGIAFRWESETAMKR